MEGRAAQRGPQTHIRTQSSAQNPEAGEAEDRCVEGEDDGGMGGEVETEEEPGQRGPDGGCLQHAARPQVREKSSGNICPCQIASLPGH